MRPTVAGHGEHFSAGRSPNSLERVQRGFENSRACCDGIAFHAASVPAVWAAGSRWDSALTTCGLRARPSAAAISFSSSPRPSSARRAASASVQARCCRSFSASAREPGAAGVTSGPDARVELLRHAGGGRDELGLAESRATAQAHHPVQLPCSRRAARVEARRPQGPQ